MFELDELDSVLDEISEVTEHEFEPDHSWQNELGEVENLSDEFDENTEPDDFLWQNELEEVENLSDEFDENTEPDDLLWQSELEEVENLSDEFDENTELGEVENVSDEFDENTEPDDLLWQNELEEVENLSDEIDESTEFGEVENVSDEFDENTEPDDLLWQNELEEVENLSDEFDENTEFGEVENLSDEFDENTEPDDLLWRNELGELEYATPDNCGNMFDFDEVKNVLHEIDTESANSARSKEIAKKPEFKPEYLLGQNDRDKAINAMIEIRTLWDYVKKDADYNYSKVYSKLSIPISEELQQECRRHKFAVYHKNTREWLVKSSDEPDYEEPKYKFYYGDEGFKEFMSAWSSKGLLLAGKYTSIKQEPNFLEKTKDAPILFDNFKLPTIKLIVGVPGCGKTRYIINNHQSGSLVLTSCSEGAQDVRARMEAKHNRVSMVFRKSYRTIDSYLLNSREPYSTVWVDEALMEHPGKIFLVCLYSRCDTMYLLGDPNQLGYINRVEDVQLLYDKSSTFFTAASTLNISHRCPVDVMAILSSKYDGGAFSTSEVLLSMECRIFTELKCVPKSDKIKYLVFKQIEKQQLKLTKYNVSTIHEFQGKEADDVVIVRMSRNPHEELYKSLAHILVGISRHKRSLVYYTPVEDDMKRLIETPLTNTDLKKVKKSAEQGKP